MSMGAPFDESSMMAVDNEQNDELNCTIVDNDVDIQSVLSGTVDDEDNDGDNQQLQLVFGKNLRSAFENADVDDELVGSNSNISNNSEKAAAGSGKSSSFTRPPLAPGRPTSSHSHTNVNNNQSITTADVTNNNDSNNSGGQQQEKRLSVYLRIRPPVGTSQSSSDNKNDEGSISTIEVVSNKNTSSSSSSLPCTIRTYPPLNSNAAKVIRSGSRTGPKTSSSSSKSFNDDGSTDSGGGNENGSSSAEIRGVKEYSYSGIFGPNSVQKDVYDNVAAPLVEGLFPKKNNGNDGIQQQQQFELGESALLFTLGVTNAGKTHTVMGSGFEKKKQGFGKVIQNADGTSSNATPHKDWGIIPRSLDHMLTRINALNKESCPGPQLQLYMSYLEIYNENIYDLLPDKTKKDAVKRYPGDGPPALKLRESRRGRIFVRGLAKHPINNVQEGLELAREAKHNRHTASNNINTHSSRSHSICQFEIAYFQGQDPIRANADDSDYDTDDDTSSVCSGSSSVSRKYGRRKSTIIWIVDLAGSERSKRTGAMSHTRHQKEAALINASLMNLMRCLREMLNHQPKKRGGTATTRGGVVPFRESKLTHMFMNHLSGPGASRTSMIVNVNPAADDYDETQHVLGYATTARSVTISAVDYNRKCRLFAKESNVKLKDDVSQVKSLAKKLVQKISPKKRKGAPDSKPEAKRQRSNAHHRAPDQSHVGTHFGSSNFKMPIHSNKSVQAGNNVEQLQQLKEERFILSQTVEELEQQLHDCEAEVREEVVATMNEQLEENKEWYESKIVELKQKVNILQTSNTMKQRTIDAQNEHINECEEEMKRMREDYEAHIEDLNSNILKLTSENQVEKETLLKNHEKDHDKCRRLEAEAGALRHQTQELRNSHSVLLSKYNELVASMKEEQGGNGKENTANVHGHGLPSPSYKKLPRERCSDVASTDCSVDVITSPKKKKGGWFMRSPAK